jgi:predicted acyl esterase
VLVYPGRTGAQRHARMLIAAGYGVLLVDRRGTGESDGEPNGWGWGSELDVHAAVEFLQHRPDVDASRIGALGLSVGGELLLQAAAEDDGLQAVVSEGAGARSVGEFAEMDGAGHWAMAPLMFSSTVATAVFSNQMPPARLHELVTKIHVPVFFINAAQGQGAEELSRNYYRSANEPKELWTTESGHVDGLGADPAEYERRVVGFLDTALLG